MKTVAEKLLELPTAEQRAIRSRTEEPIAEESTLRQLRELVLEAPVSSNRRSDGDRRR